MKYKQNKVFKYTDQEYTKQIIWKKRKAFKEAKEGRVLKLDDILDIYYADGIIRYKLWGTLKKNVKTKDIFASIVQYWKGKNDIHVRTESILGVFVCRRSYYIGSKIFLMFE